MPIGIPSNAANTTEIPHRYTVTMVFAHNPVNAQNSARKKYNQGQSNTAELKSKQPHSQHNHRPG